MRGIRVGKNFKQQVRGRAMSLKLKHKKLTYDEAKYLVLDEVFDDLSDGAYFAAMAEQGMDAENIIELSESITEKGIEV
jgi:hypothetical protein